MKYKEALEMLKTAAAKDPRDYAVINPNDRLIDKLHNAGLAASRWQGRTAQRLADMPWWTGAGPRLLGNTMKGVNWARRKLNEFGTPTNMQYSRNPGLYEFQTGAERQKAGIKDPDGLSAQSPYLGTWRGPDGGRGTFIRKLGPGL